MTSLHLTAASPRTGHLIQQQGGSDGFSAFIPNPLPPNPPVDFSGELRGLLEDASHALGRLDGITTSIHPDRLLYMYIRKEAVLSSQIEGTQSTLSDLLQYENSEAPGVPVNDVREVSSYVNALQYGMQRLANGMPISLRLIREIHDVLMQTGLRGAHQAPGEFRRTQNWIGGTQPGNARFVPPPPHELPRVLGELEQFIHDTPHRTSPIVKAGLVHAQFETIHPFLDGNGRIGRLLITFLLCAEGALSQPFLYLSLYFKEHRADYYDALQRVRSQGDWEGWMRYYLIGVAHTAGLAARTAQALLSLFAADRDRVLQLGRSASSAIRVYEYMQQRVIVSIPRTAEILGLSVPTITSALERLIDLSIVREITGKSYARQYVYQRQLDLLNS